MGDEGPCSLGPEAFAEIPWLAGLIEARPEDASWPRFISPPHPAATGSYWHEADQIGRGRGEAASRWWQSFVLARILEHDAQGDLVWLNWLVTASRQSGKTVLLRKLAMWRIHQAARFAEPQEILLASNRIRAADIVQRPVRMWARKTDGWTPRDSNGSIEIRHDATDSVWRMVAASAAYGFSSSLAVVDEAWNVPAASVDDGITPTMLERRSPQLGLASTANPRAGSLVVDRRRAVLDGSDTDTLILEWSAGRARAYDDPEGWREASPYWSPNRERIIAKAAQAVAGDDQRLAEFEAQYLNRWPWQVNAASQILQPGDPLLPADVWQGLAVASYEAADGAAAVFAVDSTSGDTATLSAAIRTPGGPVAVESYRIDDLEVASRWIGLHAGPGSVLVVGVTIRADIEVPPGVTQLVAASIENRASLAALRRVVRRRDVVHLANEELDEQLELVRFVEGRSGMSCTAGSLEAWDLIRVTAWAVAACDRLRDRAPTIY